MITRTHLAIGVVLLANWALAAAPPMTAPAAPTGASRSAQKTHSPVRGALDVTIEGDAVLEPTDPGEVRIRPEAYTGELRIQRVIAKPGQRVRKGEVLLNIDPVFIQREIEAAAHEVAQAVANYEKLREEHTMARVNADLAVEAASRELDNARVALKWYTEVDGPIAIKMTELGLKGAHDQIEDQEDELAQLKKMYKAEDLTTVTADIVIKRAVRMLERTREQYKLSEPSLTKAKEVNHPQSLAAAKATMQKAEVALEQCRRNNALADRQRALGLTGAQMALEKAKRKLEELKSDAGLMNVTAPADGILFYGSMANGQWQNAGPRALREGEKVAAQQVLMTVVQPSQLRAVICVPENKLADVKVGQKVVVTPKMLEKSPCRGVVSQISPVPGSRGGAAGFEVQIDLEKPDERLTPGMTAQTKIFVETIENALLIPTSTIKDGKVLVRNPAGAGEEREITVGKSGGQQTQILKGLTPEDQVLDR